MAALSEIGPPALLDLRRVQVHDLEPLLEEEAGAWEQRLDWDFHPPADLVRRFVRTQGLNGYALVTGRNVVGYCYYVLEDRKGLIGDLYVMDDFRSTENEERLLSAAIGGMAANTHVERVEAQLMMLQGKPRRIPMAHAARTFPRQFMMARADRVVGLPPPPSGLFTIEPWSEDFQEKAARLIARAYADHVDALINDQYQSIAGARRFLINIVQYPGCGSFFQPASFVAVNSSTGALAGICLASLVAFDSGHITQICVDPQAKGQRAGYAMLRESTQALASHGCRGISLTVTASNKEAVRLYEKAGFVTRNTFDAMVWDGLR